MPWLRYLDSMIPGALDLVIYRGTSFSVQFNCLDENGDPVDLTGWTPYSQARDKPGGRLVIDLQPTIIPPASNGQVLISLTEDQTEALDHGIYVWSFQAQQPSSGPVLGPFIAGRFVVNDESTVAPV